MAVFRVNKTDDYTVISNFHLKDLRLSLKAKGLLAVILSLPNGWNYTISGLVAICKENETAVKSALNELKKHGYLRVDKIKPTKENGGKYEYIYNVFEHPHENLPIENQGVENLPLYKNTNISSTYESNTNISSTNDITEPTPSQKKYGMYWNVLLTDEDYAKLQTEFPEDYEERIERLSEYKASSGKRYKNDLATIRAWARKDKGKQRNEQKTANVSRYGEMKKGLNL